MVAWEWQRWETWRVVGEKATTLARRSWRHLAERWCLPLMHGRHEMKPPTHCQAQLLPPWARRY